MHTLLTWLGNRDLENMEQEQNAAIVTLTTKSATPFDKIVILANKDENAPKSISSYISDPNTGHKKRILTAGVESEYYRNIPLEERYAACKKFIK